MKHVSFLLFFTLFTTLLSAQSKGLTATSNYSLDRQGLSIYVGGAYSSYQDLRFSPVQLSGGGFGVGVGLLKRTENRERRLGLHFDATNLSASLNDLHTVNKINVELSYAQQRPLGNLLGAQWLVGGEVNSELNLFNTNEFGNNSIFYTLNMGLSALSTLRFNVGNGLLSVGAGLGLLNYGSDNQSFAFSLSQSTLEDGEFAYENDKENGFFGGLNFSVLGPVRFKTKVIYQFGGRFGISYDWKMSRYAVVKGYPTTTAQHRLGINYTF